MVNGLLFIQPSTKGITVNHRPWINFKELRSRLKFDDVLRHYKVEVRSRGEQHHGPCPLPGHTGSKTAPSFSANLKRGIFQCFGCKAKGNVLEFAAFMEKVDIKNGDALREVAVKLQARFFPEGASTRKKTEPATVGSTAPLPAPVPAPAPVQAIKSASMPVLVNEPIDFELKGLDRNHEYFARCGFTIDTAQYFGIGFCSRGVFKDRIAIPLHDAEGRLIGYAGRVVDDSSVSEENPLYLFPTKRERDGRVLDFQKSEFLYNGHRIKTPCDDLIVVQDFPSVWWLHQCGLPPTVALMGSEYSEKQVEIIVSLVKPSGRLWLFVEERLGQSLLGDLTPYRFVRWEKLGESQRPNDLSAEQLKSCFM